MAILLPFLALAFVVRSDLNAARVTDLSWMTGRWTCTVWGGTYEETWLEPKDGLLPGIGRFTKGEKLLNIEFDTIQQNEKGSLDLWVNFGRNGDPKQKHVKFGLSLRDGDKYVFENKANDFPQRITYTKKSATERDCRVEGMSRGKTSYTDFHFRKVSG